MCEDFLTAAWKTLSFSLHVKAVDEHGVVVQFFQQKETGMNGKILLLKMEVDDAIMSCKSQVYQIFCRSHFLDFAVGA